MNNYYQPPGFNEQNYNNNEDVVRNAYYIEKARLEIKQIRHLGNIIGLAVTAYYVFSIILSYILSIPKLGELYDSSALFQNCFGIVTIDLIGMIGVFGIMAYINRKKYTGPLIPAKKLGFKETYLWVTFGLLGCMLANYLSAIVMVILQWLGHNPYTPDPVGPDSVLSIIALAIGTAIMPGLCEEFAMRCCNMGLLKKYGKAFSVISISLIFGMMHGNISQFVFATAVGLILGYVTVKTDSVLPAVLIHIFNNSRFVLMKIFEYVFNEKAGSYVVAALLIIYIVLGVNSTIIMAAKGRFKRNKNRTHEPFENSVGKKVFSFFFTPGMIIPLLAFFSLIINSIR